jgi:hypothetical protein
MLAKTNADRSAHQSFRSLTYPYASRGETVDRLCHRRDWRGVQALQCEIVELVRENVFLSLTTIVGLPVKLTWNSAVWTGKGHVPKRFIAEIDSEDLRELVSDFDFGGHTMRYWQAGQWRNFPFDDFTAPEKPLEIYHALERGELWRLIVRHYRLSLRLDVTRPVPRFLLKE